MIRKKCQITNRLGLHARAAAKLVQMASTFVSEIEISYNGQIANGKSIMGIMMLAASNGTWIDVMIHGDDEENAMYAITRLIAERFKEEQ